MVKTELTHDMIDEYDDENISYLPLFHKLEKIREPLVKGKNDAQSRPKPFVKWVGGKRSLLHEIIPAFPERFNHYYEPFVGGGAVFFAGHEQIKKAFLSDSNLELILTYTAIQKAPEQLIEKLKFHSSHHSKEYYYEVRSHHCLREPIELAARFIYLNKTCYNGLYRVNKSGKFNTPIGKYKRPNIVQEDNIWTCHYALQNVSIQCLDFDKIQPERHDFVYFDPPYHPTNDISFTEYTSSNFTETDQIRLRDFAAELHKSGVHVMLSNSDTTFIRKAYSNSKIFNITTVQAPRYVNCKPNQRGAINELLITNKL